MNPILSYLILSYPTLSYPTLPYPILPYLPSEIVFKSFAHEGYVEVGEAVQVSVLRYPQWVVNIGDRCLAWYG